MDDKTACQTPSREISARMKRLRLHATEFKQKVDREFAPIDRDDSLNSTFDSEVGSPMRLITRASLCHDERLGSKFEHWRPAIRDRLSRIGDLVTPYAGHGIGMKRRKIPGLSHAYLCINWHRHFRILKWTLKSSQFQFSPLLRPNHSIDFSARSKTDPIKPSQSESEVRKNK